MGVIIETRVTRARIGTIVECREDKHKGKTIMIGIENAKHYARVEAIEYAKSLGLEVEVSEDRRWYIVGPFESQEKLSEFGEIAELLGLDTTICLYAGCMLKFA